MVSPPIEVDSLEDGGAYIIGCLDVLSRIAGGEPSDVVMFKLLHNEYTLHAVGDDGFVVLDWFEEGACHIVSAYAYGGKCETSVAKALEAVKFYVRLCGCDRLTFSSTRKAWRRLAPKLGATVTPVEYEVKV